MKKIVVIGCGGHAKSVIDIIERTGEYEIAGFADRKKDESFSYRGYKIIAADEEFDMLYRSGIKYAAVGIGYMGAGNLRQRMYDRLKEAGFYLPVLRDPSAVAACDVRAGEGAIIGKAAVVNSDAVIGRAHV